MKLFKQVLVGVAVAAALATSAQASISAGGVTWDPDYTDAADKDFIAEFKFTQWYSTVSSTTPNSITNYDSAVQIGTVTSVLGASSTDTGFSSYYLQGVGEVDRVNKSDDPFTSSTNELTLAFGGIRLNLDGTFDTSDAWGRLHVNDVSPNYTTPASNQAEVNDALDGSNWLELEFDSLVFTLGGVLNGEVSAELTIVGGDAAQYFVPNTLAYTADAFFLPDASYSAGGNGSVLGNTEIPEPESLALVGLGLLGLAAARRRKIAK